MGGGGSKYVDVGPFSLKLFKVLDLFTSQRVFLKIIGEGGPYTPSPELIDYTHVLNGVLTIIQQWKII